MFFLRRRLLISQYWNLTKKMEATKSTINECQIFELNGNTIFMKNRDHVHEVLRKIKVSCPSKLQIIADFDWTLSNFDHHEKDINPTSFDILQDTGFMNEDVKKKILEMKNYYLPFLMDIELTSEVKKEKMLEWWNRYNDVICNSTNIHISDIKKMVQNSNATFRHNADKFFTLCNLKSVPVSIISAGIGDIIEEMLIQNINVSFENVKIISNFLEYNENKTLVQFKKNLIHVFNKNEALISDKEHLKLINNRTNVIVLGDSEGDHDMAESLENVENILKIGFLNSHVDKLMDKYLNLFDVVLVKDSTLDVPIKILTYLLNSN